MASAPSSVFLIAFAFGLAHLAAPFNPSPTTLGSGPLARRTNVVSQPSALRPHCLLALDSRIPHSSFILRHREGARAQGWGLLLAKCSATDASAEQKFVDGLKDHIEGLWNGPIGSEDWRPYAKDVVFEDPFESLEGIEAFKKGLQRAKKSALTKNPHMLVHDVARSKNGGVRARWTLTTEVSILPWKPRILFTGVSSYSLSESGQVQKLVDKFDSVDGYALSAIMDVLFGDSGIWREPPVPDVELPESTVLFRGKDYQIRRIAGIGCVEVDYDQRPQTKKDAVDRINDYWLGKNEQGMVLKPTAPSLTWVADQDARGAKWIASILPREFAKPLPAPQPPFPLEKQAVRFARYREGNFVVATIPNSLDPLDGWVSTETVYEVKTKLLENMRRDGIKPAECFQIARYIEVYGRGDSRYELWIPVESYELRAAPLFTAAEDGSILPGIKIDFSNPDE